MYIMRYCGVALLGAQIKICFNQVTWKLSLFTQQQLGTQLSSEMGKV